MISIQDQQNLLIDIAKRLQREITAYAIGGTAMMFLGFKEATLDIDIVFTKAQDRKDFKEAAKSLGYKEMDSTIVYGLKNNCPEMIKLSDSRLDLFLLDVIDFTFSDSMQARAEQLHQFDKNLILKIANIHDIIIMKCATRRAKDEEDIINIVKKSTIKWNLLVEEAKKQVILGRETGVLDLGNLLEVLKNKRQIDVPKHIIDNLWKFFKKQADDKSKMKIS